MIGGGDWMNSPAFTAAAAATKLDYAAKDAAEIAGHTQGPGGSRPGGSGVLIVNPIRRNTASTSTTEGVIKVALEAREAARSARQGHHAPTWA